MAGGLAALLLAQGAVRLLVRFGPRELPRLEKISIDANVLLFGLAVSLAAGLLLGLLPAWHASAVAASGHMTAGARGATSGRDRQLVRRGLVVVQIGLALTLLVGSGLTVRSFQRLAAVDPGFDPVDALTFALALPPRDYDTPDSRLSFYRQVVDRLRAPPGAVDAAASSTLPLDGVLNSGGHSIEGRPLAEARSRRRSRCGSSRPATSTRCGPLLSMGECSTAGRGARCTGRHPVAVAGARAVAGRRCAGSTPRCRHRDAGDPHPARAQDAGLRYARLRRHGRTRCCSARSVSTGSRPTRWSSSGAKNCAPDGCWGAGGEVRRLECWRSRNVSRWSI